MRRSWTSGWCGLAAALCYAVGMAGCNSFPSSGIDPTGEHVFAPPPPPPCSAPAAVARQPPTHRASAILTIRWALCPGTTSLC